MTKENTWHILEDPAAEAKIETLLAEMTLEEKVGQLVQISPHGPFDFEAFEQEKETALAEGRPVEFKPALRKDLDDLIRSGQIGSVLNLMDAGQVNHCQQVAVEESRLGIPLLIGADVIHGFRTMFPIPLAESCTWNPGLLERASRTAAQEAAAVGINWIFAPMVDVARDPRWGRIAESAGEDPFLGMAMARARVLGFQAGDLHDGKRIVACPKHFAGYAAAEAGRDYNTVDISERTLRDVHLPPFKAAFDAGAGSVMTAFNELSGVPATGSSFLFRDVLRDEWGWTGVVLSDYGAIMELVPHGYAADLEDAGRLGLLAGVDIDMMGQAYELHLAGLVRAGAVPEERIDEAVRRVLTLKFGLGLFDDPYVDESFADVAQLQPAALDLALEVARESVVLLKNEGGMLPLPEGARVALIGPLGDNQADLLGTWAISGRPQDVETLRQGFRAHLPDEQLIFAEGCPIEEFDTSAIPAAVAAAEQADFVVLALGESAGMSGEAHSRSQLGLPGAQNELFEAIAATGKPVVTILMSGRPLVVPAIADRSDALLAAWHGGVRAGRALADLVFGAANPSGKLTASWPRNEGQIPVYYAAKRTGRPAADAGIRQFAEVFKSVYMDVPNSPLFPFGYGLSYTDFAYSDLQIEQAAVPLDGMLVASAVVENTGDREGAEVVQLYVQDLVGSVTRPVRELKGFRKVRLAAGERQRVRFEVPVAELGFTGPGMQYVVEPGDFRVWIGPDSVSGLEGEFVVRGVESG